MIPEDEISYIRKRIKESSRPLFFFDDDADGVTSFIQLYKLAGDGKGVCVKGKPILEETYVRKVDEYSPDLIIILDKPMVSQDFLDNVTQEVLWIDHHPLQDNKKVKYFNPRKLNPEDNRPTSYWAYQIAKENVQNILWIAMIGIVGDWNLLLADEFRKEYPKLLPNDLKTPPDALFNSKVGDLVKVITWNLMGTTSDVNKSIKILTRINSPEEILEQTSSQGKFIFRKYLKMNTLYEELMSRLKVPKGKFLVFKYQDNKFAFSSSLSNELLYRYPEKIIMVVREKPEEVSISLRSSKEVIVDKLKEALKVTTGYGGGHDHACGASMKRDEFDRFMVEFKKQFKKSRK